MNMDFYEQQLNDYIIKSFQRGITTEDYEWLKRYIKEIEEKIENIAFQMSDLEYDIRITGIEALENRRFFPRKNVCQTLENWKEEIRRYRDIQTQMWELAYGFEQTVLERSSTSFALYHASLVHLTYTNNTFGKIKPHSTDSYMLLCQHHLERTPSMSVCSSSNSSFCYGCGVSRNPLSYLTHYEALSKKEALMLLRRIYLIDVKGEVPVSPLLQKYRDSLLSDEYRNLLETGRERTSQKEDSYRKRYALIRYQEHLDTIDRVREGRVLFHQDSLPKQKVYRMNVETYQVGNNFS